MREIVVGEKTIRVRATPLALLYYKQTFGADLIGDMVKMKDLKEDPTSFDSVACLQLIWAMAKADAYGKQFPSFEVWLSGIEIDFSDQSFLMAALEEAADGFLGGGKSIKKQGQT